MMMKDKKQLKNSKKIKLKHFKSKIWQKIMQIKNLKDQIKLKIDWINKNLMKNNLKLMKFKERKKPKS